MSDNNKSSTLEQVLKFGIIGVMAVGLDFVVYYASEFIFEAYLDNSYTGIGKSLGFWAGTTFTYFMNKNWTWKQKGHSTSVFAKFLILYGLAWGVNVGVNELFLRIIPEYRIGLNFLTPDAEELFNFGVMLNKLIAFGIAVVVTATVTFIGQKYWVFKAKDGEQPTPAMS